MSQISNQQAAHIVRYFYNIDSTATRLKGYSDENFLIESDDNFLLKISKDSNDIILFQMQLNEFLVNIRFPFTIAKYVLNEEGEWNSKISETKSARLLHWIPGRLWTSVNPKTEELRRNLGKFAGCLTKALFHLDHPYGHRKIRWDLAHAGWTKKYVDRFSGEQYLIVSHFQNRYSEIQHVYKKLPNSLIHNDLNDHNIIVSTDDLNPRIVGIIDFGDAINTKTINDIAICLAYATMELPDPLSASLEIIAEYYQFYKFSEKELECLYVLVGMRLVTTVVSASLNKEKFPEEEYLIVSEKPAWNLLEKWFKINENFALNCFRTACGYSAHPLEDEFKPWALRNQISLKTLFPTIDFDEVKNLDMSVGSTLLGNPSEYNDPEISEFKLNQYRKQNPNAILLNGYLEPRPFYNTDAFKREGNNGPQYRTVHLGTDFWVPSQTPVHAPYDGIVKIIHHNNFDKDYGPMIIIEHPFKNKVFYTLYGHLSLNSLQLLRVGQNISQDELIGYVGTSSENGNWAPHLHFQIILDLLGNNENFNGVAFPSEINVWRSICPDPNLLFKEELKVPNQAVPEKSLLQFRKKHLGSGLSLSYDKPLHIVRGEGVYLIDGDGRKYLDTVNNVNHVGHQHPKVVAAGQRQMAVLNTNTRYLHEEIIAYSKELLKKLPPHLSVIHIVNSGSEANELAIRMAKSCTGREDFMAIEAGYHGNTNAAIDVSSYKFGGIGGEGCPDTTHILPLPDSFRGKYMGPDRGKKYAQHATDIIENLKKEGRQIAGFIGESMISCGGQIVPPSNYFKEVYKHVREAGGICIADEVQTGFGRMGKTFWAFELFDVLPDIVTMGKPAGNGHPLAIVACTEKVANQFNTGMEYFNTFGGNPVSCAIGRTVLEVIEEENLQQNALEVGKFLKSELTKFLDDFPICGDVRGEGLFLGFELTDFNRGPMPEHATYVINRMKQLGVLMSIDGPDHNVLKIKPPMVFSMENAKELILRLRTVFAEDYMVNFEI